MWVSMHAPNYRNLCPRVEETLPLLRLSRSTACIIGPEMQNAISLASFSFEFVRDFGVYPVAPRTVSAQ